MATFPPFAWRRNRDSSIDSICTNCFQTIASAACVDDLAAHEQEHVCDPFGEIVSRHAESQNRWCQANSRAGAGSS
jgi:hypothetical protein